MTANSEQADDFFKRFYARLRYPLTEEEIENFNECMEERAGIMEYEAGLSRQEAEQQTKVICFEAHRTKKYFHK